MQLYPHNQQSYETAVSLFQQQRKVCIIQPTGTGKAVIIGKFITSNPTARHLLLAPGEHIQAEVSKHVNGSNFTFCTYLALLSPDTLTDLINFDFIYLDEFHRIGAEEWGSRVKQLLYRNYRAKVLGTTATHIRFLDNRRDMAVELFRNNIASYMSLSRAFLEGILIAPKYISAIYSVSQEMTRTEEAIRNSGHPNWKVLLREMRDRVIDWENSSGLDKVLKRHLPPSRKRLIIFCTTLEQMKLAESTLTPILNDIFGSFLSLPIHSLFGKKTNNRRVALFREESDETRVLFTVNMIAEGLHGKDISTVIMVRETSSPIIWYQQIGRCLSVGQKEQPIIFDLVNNFRNIQHNRFRQDFEDEQAQFIETAGSQLEGIRKKPTVVEFIDETQAIRDILTSFDDSIDKWETGYAQARLFFERAGHLRVSKDDDIILYLWIRGQRRLFRAGALSESQVLRLTQIGMDWKYYAKESWQANYLRLKKFIEEHGSLSSRSIEKRIGGWFTRQKRLYQQNKLTQKQRTLLEEIISMENDRMVLWKNKLQRLEEYFNEHKQFPSGRGSDIQRHANQVRASLRMGSLPDFVYQRLKELGFKFRYERYTYEQTLDLLIAFIKENNGKRPSENTNLYLRQWLSTQCSKYRYGRLEEERVRLFRSKEAATGLKLLPDVNNI